MDKINRRELLATAIPVAVVAAVTSDIEGADFPDTIVETAAVPIPMGLGELGNPKNTFLRQFRFLFWFDHMGPDFNHSVKFDRVAKEIRFKNYELANNNKVIIQDWIDAMLDKKFPNETMTLATYDGCGFEIYRKRFTGLKIKQCISTFDMSSSECSLPEVCLSYEKYEDVTVGGDKHKTLPKEFQVDHLNGRMYII